MRESHAGAVLGVAFFPDGRHAISSGVDETARVWDLQTGEAVERWKGPSFKFVNAAIANDSRRALSAADGPVYWDVTTGTKVFELSAADSDRPSAVALSVDGHLGASASPGTTFVWNLDNGSLVRSFPMLGRVLSIEFRQDGLGLTVVSDQSVCSADARGTAEPTCTELPLSGMGAPTTAGIGERDVLFGTRRGELLVWNRSTHELKDVGSRPPGEVVGLSYLPKMHRALTTSSGSAWWWDVAGKKVLGRLATGAEPLPAVTSEDGRLALIGSEDGTVWLWKLP